MLNAVSHASSVGAALNYLVPGEQKSRIVMPAEGQARRTSQYKAHQVPISDLRPRAGELSLDVQGFELAEAPSAVRDFRDDEEVRRVYYPETERLVQQRTGAAKVLIFDHTVRIDAADDEQHRKPVRTVHNDYTLRSGPQRVCDLVDAGEARTRLGARFAVINTWRPINAPALSAPLAIADARSVAAEHFIASDLVYSDRVGEIYDVAYDPAHVWYYAPRMTPDEVLLLKTYDSAVDGRARFTAHSAFDDPTAPADAPPRQSIELRMLVFFEESLQRVG